MAYTLKSNSTTAAANIVFVGENGLVNLVSGGPAISAVGAMNATTVGGHTVYGDGQNVAGNYLTATLTQIATGAQKFSVLLMGHYGLNPNDDLNYVTGPQFSMGARYNSGGADGTIHAGYNNGGNVYYPSAVSPGTGLNYQISGRDIITSTARLVNYYNATRGAEKTAGAGSDTIAAGEWRFGGRPSSGSAGAFGVGIFAVFVGIGPQDLADAIAAAGGDPYALLFDAPADTTPPTLTSPTGAATSSSTASVGASTTESGGAMYCVVTTTATTPTAVQVEAGQNSSGTSSPAANAAVAATGPKVMTVAGLSAGTPYYGHSMHKDAAGNRSNVVTSAAFTTPSAATAVTMSGPSSGVAGAASTNFTVGANGTITGTVTVTPSDGGGGSFTPSSVAISSATPTATFTYTPASAGAKTISVTNNGGLSNPSTISYTATAVPSLTSSPLKLNNGTLHLSAAFEAFVLNVTTGALVLRKTGLTSHASTGVVTFTDAALSAATQYRVVWRRTDTGAQGVELLTTA